MITSYYSSTLGLLFTEEISAEEVQHMNGPQKSGIMVGPTIFLICINNTLGHAVI